MEEIEEKGRGNQKKIKGVQTLRYGKRQIKIKEKKRRIKAYIKENKGKTLVMQRKV